ncbi:hypothetical protein K1719_012155 [Acacia pycnantha]|nr:hypothetical protein K1719_012155 [Acacia pycnantha]
MHIEAESFRRQKQVEVAKVQRIKTNIPQSSGWEHNGGRGSRGKTVDTVTEQDRAVVRAKSSDVGEVVVSGRDDDGI